MKCTNEAINICHVISGDIWGGAEAQSFSLVKALSDIDNINIIVIVFNSGELHKRLLSENIKTYIINEVDKNAITLALNIYRRLKQNKVDIVHVHGFKENFTAGLAGKLISAVIIRTHHGKGMVSSKGLNARIEKVNEKLLSQGLIAVSEDLKKYLMKCQFSENKIEVIHNGLDCSSEICGDVDTLREAIGICKNNRVIGIVGRLVPVKNHICFLDSAKIMLKKNVGIYFIVVGDGPLLGELTQYAKLLGIAEHVKFVGFKSNIRVFLELFDVLTITSFHEGVPIIMLEAMCADVPVVSTKVGGVSEVIQHEYNGLLVPDNDSVVLSNECIRLLENRQLYDIVSRNAKNDMRQKYSMHNNVNETMQYYRRFVS